MTTTKTKKEIEIETLRDNIAWADKAIADAQRDKARYLAALSKLIPNLNEAEYSNDIPTEPGLYLWQDKHGQYGVDKIYYETSPDGTQTLWYQSTSYAELTDVLEYNKDILWLQAKIPDAPESRSKPR
uniref:Uncharacterized protein n=1 Tax=viral metagenome TaxID=1070528 RepID=A0A6M3LJ37_9ZZZZ